MGAVSEPYELDGVSISGTEISIVSGSSSLQNVTDDGAFQLGLDPVGAGLTKGDEFILRVKEKILSGGTQRLVFSQRFTHLTFSENHFYPVLWLMHGWDMTLQKIAGTDRNWDASIRQIAGPGLTEYDTLSAVTVGSSELSILSGTTSLPSTTDAGVYQIWVDSMGASLAKDDKFTFRLYEKVEGTGGSKRVVLSAQMHHYATETFVLPGGLALKNGWDATLQKTAGTDRAFSASVRRAA